MFDALIIIPEITKGMKSIGSKALLKIKNSIGILDYQINQLNKIKGLRHINIATGFDVEKIKKSISSKHTNISIINNDNYQHTNQTESLLLYLQNNQPTDLLVISNGILFKNIFDKCNKKVNSTIYFLDKPKANFNIGCNNTENVEYLFYDFPLLWAECVFFNKDTVGLLKTLSNSNCFKHYYLFETINYLLENKIQFEKELISKKDIMKIATIKDIPKAKLFI
jgi:hypothetical protein